MDLAVVLSLIAGLFVVVALTEPLAARLGLPFTVLLAAMGVLIGAGATFFWRTDLTDALNPVALAILQFPIRANVFLYIFLPTLLFQVALTVNARRMLDDWVPILTLAVVAVAVATVFIGYALMPFTSLPLAACLLIGAIVSTTDPSAVVSLFRALPAPQRLARIIEGESLLNDAAAIALFGLFLGFVTVGAPDPDLAQAILGFPWLLLGGAAAGWVAGRLAVLLMEHIPAHPLAQVSVSVALPYLTFLGTQNLLGASGVVAVVAAGLAVNLTAPRRLSPASLATLRDTWDLLAHWAGAFIFILAAIFIPRLLSTAVASDLVLIFVAAVAALVARAAILFGVLPLLGLLRLSPRVERPYRVAILWGGLRGAVTLALALAVTESFSIAPEVKRQVGIVATGFTLFTLIVQGLSLKPLIRFLGLDRLTPVDSALGDQVVAVALQTVRDRVEDTAQRFGLSPGVIEAETVVLSDRLDAALMLADEGTEILDRDRITLGLVALAGHERNLLLDLFRRDVIPADLAETLLGGAERLIERTRAEGRTGYLRTARAAHATGRAQRLAEAAHNRLGLSRPLARMTETRFDLLLAEGLVLRELHSFIDERIRRIHGSRVADLLHDLLDRRSESSADALTTLRLQFPGYAEALERRLIRRTAAQLEEREYDQLWADGLVGPELRAMLKSELDRRWIDLATRPKLDLALHKDDLVRRFPLFADMDETQLARLKRSLRTVYARSGKIVMRRAVQPRQVSFIASGAVEVSDGSVQRRLGAGEMFGHFSALRKVRTQAEITTLCPTTLLVLDEARFIALLSRNEGLLRAVEESARRRGIDFDLAPFTTGTRSKPSEGDTGGKPPETEAREDKTAAE